MDDSFQFIIESPQHSQGHKKRPRLVTSCDNCRLKKIKCLLPSPESKCEACKSAKIPCRFRDRERYFAERSRAIAGPNSGLYATDSGFRPDPMHHDPTHDASSSSPHMSPHMSSHSHHSHSRPISDAKASGMVSADIDSARYPYTSDHRHVAGSHHHKHHSSVSSFDSTRSNNGYYGGHSSSQPLHYPPSSRSISYQPDHRSVQLFDPENPQRPNPSLMSHYINVFFEQHGAEFPFLNFQDINRDFWDQRLSTILANCIAAMASQMSSLPELSIRGLHNVSESYIDVAKNPLPSVAHLPSMETLHSIILLSWFEHSHHRLPGFRTFCGMAFKMSTDLGLQDPTSIDMCHSEYERHRRRTTMAAIMHLHMTYNSVRQ